LKIAIFTEVYYPFLSGVITHIETLKNALESQGHNVLIITTDPAAEKHYLKDGVLYCPAKTLKKIYGYGFTSPISRKRLKFIEEFAPDVCHIHTEFTIGLFGLHVAKKLKLPIVYTLHTMYDDYVFYIAPKPFERIAIPASHVYFRKIAEQADEIIGPSTKVVEYLRRCKVFRPVNIVPNTVDLTQFLPENIDPIKVHQVKTKLGITDGDTALCFVGRLGKEKSLDALITFFANAFKSDAKKKLFIIGDGPEGDMLKQQVEKEKINNVFFLGRIEHNDLPAYYAAFNLYATASLSEINSISMLEAFASGLYVLHRKDPLNPNQVIDGENGKLFDNNTEFKEAVERYTALPDVGKAVLRQNVSASANRYGSTEFVKSILHVYNKAMIGYRAKK